MQSGKLTFSEVEKSTLEHKMGTQKNHPLDLALEWVKNRIESQGQNILGSAPLLSHQIQRPIVILLERSLDKSYSPILDDSPLSFISKR